MIAITAYYKYLDGQFCPIDKPAYANSRGDNLICR